MQKVTVIEYLFCLEFPSGYISFRDEESGARGIFSRFYITDHSGSIRMIYDGRELRSLRSTVYLPSGVVYDSSKDEGIYGRRYFCGKEKLPVSALRLYDSGARLQDDYIPRFTTMDPLCEKYYDVSPYAYCHNDPVNFIDIKGMFDSESAAMDYANKHHVGLSNVHYAFDRNEWYVAFGEDRRGYVNGGILERRFHEKAWESRWWNITGNVNTDLGAGLGFAGWGLAKPLARSNAYVFTDGTGKYINSVKPSFRVRGLDVDFNLQTTNKIASGLKSLGRASSLISFGMNAYEIYEGKKNIIGEGGLDLIMIGVGGIPLYGWAISCTYFLGKSALEYNDLDFWNK